LTKELLIIAGLALPIHALLHVTYFTIRSGGKTFITFLFDCVYTWLIPFPIAYILSRFTNYPVTVIYFCVQFVDLFKVFIGIFLLRSGIWAENIVNETKK
jgi:Na+-driven multidrug efflux pump